MIYDRPTKVLMREFSKEILQKGKIFSKQDAVDWFRKKYPKIKSNTVELHVEGMAVNNLNHRVHHKQIRPGTGFDLFYKIGQNRFRLWEPEIDPAPVYLNDAVAQRSVAESEDVSAEGDSDEEMVSAASEFAFEHDLRNYLAKNLDVLEKGLKLYRAEGLDGIEYPAGGRFIDILAVNADNEFVIIELKVSRGYDRVVGQILRYMGWVEKNLTEEGKGKVHGIIVASEITDDLKLAASRIAGVKLVEYEIAFKLKPVAS